MQEGLEIKEVVILIHLALVHHRWLHKNERYCNCTSLYTCSGLTSIAL